MLHITELTVADPPESWEAAGFDVDVDGTCRLGHVRVRLGAEGRGITGWSFTGVDAPAGPVELDGLATTVVDDPATCEPAAHPNGVVQIDHVVLLSPIVDRTVTAFAALGVEPRRERLTDTYGSPMRQVFFRAGEVIIELVGPDDAEGARPFGDGPCGFFGLAHTVSDLDATAALLGEHLGAAKEAVQPGRRIATLRHKAVGMRVATAFMSPDPS